MPSRSSRRRYVRRSRLYWFVRRYGYVVAALVALAGIQLLGSGKVVIDDTSPAPLSMLEGVKFIVPSF